MAKKLEETDVETKVKHKYGDEAGEKIYKVLKDLDEKVLKDFDKVVKKELHKEAEDVDYELLRQWISLGG